MRRGWGWLVLVVSSCASGVIVNHAKEVASVAPGPSSLGFTADSVCTARRGDLVCWGSALAVPVDYWSTADQTIHAPGRIPTAAAVAAVAAGDWLTCALLVDGRVRCWGSNLHGSRGAPRCGPFPDGFDGYAALPRPAAELAVRNHRACARLVDGSVACWGEVLGLAGSFHTCGPTRVTTESGEVLREVVSIDVDAAIDAEGGLWVWGSDYFGELGRDGGPRQPSEVAVRLDDLGPMRAVARADGLVCGVERDGDVVCWGDTEHPEPAVPPARDVACHNDVCCALTESSEVWCWGLFVEAIGSPGGRAMRLATSAHSVTVGWEMVCVEDLGPKRPLRCWGRDPERIGSPPSGSRWIISRDPATLPTAPP